MGKNETAMPASGERILQAARIEFEKYGFAGARVDRIADAANANKQLVYRYFKDKQGLYDAVVNHLIDVLQQTNARTPGRGIRRMAPTPEQLREDAAIRESWTRILSWESLQPVSSTDASLKFIRANYERYIAELTEDPDAEAALSRFPRRMVFALLLAADHLPFGTPSAFAAALGKESVEPGDVEEWFDFVHEFVSSINPK